jgi:hypothetical protein
VLFFSYCLLIGHERKAYPAMKYRHSELDATGKRVSTKANLKPTVECIDFTSSNLHGNSFEFFLMTNDSVNHLTYY